MLFENPEASLACEYSDEKDLAGLPKQWVWTGRERELRKFTGAVGTLGAIGVLAVPPPTQEPG